MTPSKDCWSINVPREIEQHVAVGQSCGQKLVEVFRSDTTDLILHSLRNEIRDAIAIIEEVDNSDALRVNLHVSNEKGECALSNTATAQYKDATGDERCD